MKRRVTNRILRRVLLSVNILIVAAFVVGYLAVWIPPRMLWWVQPFGVLLPLTTILLTLTAVLHLVWGAWGTAGAHALLILLFASRTVNISGNEADRTHETLRVMTLNARFSWDVTNAFPDNTVDSLVAAEEPHVIALQEASVLLHAESHEIEMLLPVEIRLTERGYRTYPANTAERRQHNPVVARIPIEDHEDHHIPEPERGRHSPTFTRTVVDFGGARIAVYNVHLRSFSGLPDEERSMRPRLDPRSWPERWSIFRETYRTHADQIEALVAMLDDETLPFIVCGDLNSTPHNWTYGRLNRVARDAWRLAGRGRGATFPARFPLVRIDYVFAGPGWSVLDSQVAGPAKSDHRAVFADLAR